ncbi:11-beta-hydroxysteroid dehydrogenase 1B-like [Vigna unguiculata]|uniref:11-beta-hydroxysteroid dehydrogenase 1B-like n=1 Tax=Vigna unguiculata TaxID=3917 RepID=UPI0010168023|nr:11-beta-hydroxysteroid dehydrogenase 1B-like [Vigna unguiculata]
MAFFHGMLNVLVPALSLAILLLILPPFLLFKILRFIVRSISREDVAGKVVLITGASSGIGEHLAYEYAKRGARLALVARRENRIKEVAGNAKLLGSPDVITIPADVSRPQDCQRFVDSTINHFGRLDHLVNNAGINALSMFEDTTDITNFAPVMDINFWGSAYSTYFSIPHLRQSKGKIVAVASCNGWLPVPKMSIYNASKAAVISLYETLRTELGRDIGITIVTPGLIESEMSQGKILSNDGKMVFDQQIRDMHVGVMPIRSVTEAAKAIVNSVCRGDSYLTEPAWFTTTFYWQVCFPEMLGFFNRSSLTSESSEEDPATSKKVLDLKFLKKYINPKSVRSPNIKPN